VQGLDEAWRDDKQDQFPSNKEEVEDDNNYEGKLLIHVRIKRSPII